MYTSVIVNQNTHAGSWITDHCVFHIMYGIYIGRMFLNLKVKIKLSLLQILMPSHILSCESTYEYLNISIIYWAQPIEIRFLLLLAWLYIYETIGLFGGSRCTENKPAIEYMLNRPEMRGRRITKRQIMSWHTTLLKPHLGSKTVHAWL